MRVPAFLVIGGGADGDNYVRQLLRAVAAGRLQTGLIRVIDRDPACLASRRVHPLVRVEAALWSEWLDENLDRCAPDDQLVPYHWAPHLLRTWLERQLAARGARVERGGALAPRGLPYEGDTSAGDRALSYASWVCPVFCIEPALCPHTRGPRDWSLAGDLSRDEDGLDAIVFGCLHLVWGVGTIPVAEIRAARDRMVARLAEGPRTYRIATSSHCHALATVVKVERA